ncbi:heterokaryon incompatibility protein-domain-containing protein [Nemania abortiva]|nr:heterokaryon incompatibility protein-domain-containing protein [Nemania abortiva]
MAQRKLVSLPLQQYQYQSLPPSAQTRIIVLEPSGDASAPLVCKIEELIIESDEGFQALSYTWGEPNFTERLIVDNTTFLRITPNLRDALRRFRKPFSPRRLWVDAVCINQQDEEEKRRQIPFMDVIYRGASAVLVWLGNYPTQAACLASIKAYPRLLGKERTPGSRVGRQEHSELLMSISSLVQLPWFSRRWIVQEAVLNPDVLLCCCDEELSWVRLANCLGLISNPPPDAKSLHTLLSMADLWKRWVLDGGVGGNGGIFDLLEAFDHFECFDPRDRLFALGGLATDISMGTKSSSGLLPLHVDYTIATESLYTTFCTDVIEFTSERMKYDMLRSSLARCGDRQNNLASWVPDWRLPATRKPFYHYVVYNSLLHIEYTSSRLLLRGQYVRKQGTKVSAVFEPLPTHPLSPSDIANWLRKAGNLWLDRYPSAGLQPFAALIEECARNTGLQPSGDAVFAMISWVMSSDQLALSGADEHVYLLLDIGAVLKGRRVFYWSDLTDPFARFGIGPDHTQIGDEMIAVMRPSSDHYSFQVALVIRDSTGDSAKLVGDSLLVLRFKDPGSWFPSPPQPVAQHPRSMSYDPITKCHTYKKGAVRNMKNCLRDVVSSDVSVTSSGTPFPSSAPYVQANYISSWSPHGRFASKSAPSISATPAYTKARKITDNASAAPPS